MKRYLCILCLALLAVVATPADAQNIPIGKRIPDVRPQEWMGGVRPVREAKLTCIEFFHPSSRRSKSNIESLMALSSGFTHRDFQVVIIAAGDEDAIRTALTPYAEEGIAVGIDRGNECFKALGINYLPACIIIDDQKKIIWTGDSKTLTPKLIKNLNQK